MTVGTAATALGIPNAADPGWQGHVATLNPQRRDGRGYREGQQCQSSSKRPTPADRWLVDHGGPGGEVDGPQFLLEDQ